MIHAERTDALAFITISRQIIEVAVPDQIKRTNCVRLAVVLQHLLFPSIKLKVQERNLSTGVDRINNVIALFVV